MFNEQDAAVILGIPLNEEINTDNWYWNRETSGIYSVKSAYRWLMSKNSAGQSSDFSRARQKFWKLKTPPKTKDTVWRAATNCLPTRTNLQRIQVPVSSNCPLCNVFNETTWHCLVDCEFSWNCWEISGLAVSGREASSFFQWLVEIMESLDSIEGAKAVMVCWSIWRACNEIVWNQRWRVADEVVSYAMLSLNQYLAAQNVGNLTSLNSLLTGDGAERWTKPATRTIKVNVDAAIFKAEKHFGYAYVVRDEMGILVEAAARYVPGIINAVVAEAMGIKEALAWIKNQQHSKVELESNNLVSIQAICEPVHMSYTFGLVIQECKKFMESLSNVSLHFFKCSANRVAHVLARKTRGYADRIFREGYAPTELDDVLMKERME